MAKERAEEGESSGGEFLIVGRSSVAVAQRARSAETTCGGGHRQGNRSAEKHVGSGGARKTDRCQARGKDHGREEGRAYHEGVVAALIFPRGAVGFLSEPGDGEGRGEGGDGRWQTRGPLRG